MLTPSIVLFACLAWTVLLFGVALWGERQGHRRGVGQGDVGVTDEGRDRLRGGEVGGLGCGVHAATL